MHSVTVDSVIGRSTLASVLRTAGSSLPSARASMLKRARYWMVSSTAIPMTMQAISEVVGDSGIPSRPSMPKNRLTGTSVGSNAIAPARIEVNISDSNAQIKSVAMPSDRKCPEVMAVTVRVAITVAPVACPFSGGGISRKRASRRARKCAMGIEPSTLMRTVIRAVLKLPSITCVSSSPPASTISCLIADALPGIAANAGSLSLRLWLINLR